MDDSMRTLGWTLIHFLWQGTVVALLTATALRACRSASARHAVACAGLALMLAAPALTFAILASPRRGPEGAAPARSGATLPAPAAPSPVPPAVVSPAPGVGGSIEAALPALVAAWMAGVALLLTRFAGGCWKVRRIAKTALLSPPSALQPASDRLASRLGFLSSVPVRDSLAISTPMVIGWLRPVVVLPAAAFANLTPLQVDAVLAHELAHLRRHDYAVNLAQTIAEVLLFYHPAVWWLSARIREEREHCCDDVAIGVCGEPCAYVEALTELETWRSLQRTGPALAATDGSLLRRARRLLRSPEAREPRSLTGVLSVLGCLAALAVVTIVAASSAAAVDGMPGGRTAAAARRPEQGGAASALPPGEWRVHATAHFDVYHPPDLDLHAQRVGLDAERAYAYSSAELQHDLGSKVSIVLFRRGSDIPGAAGPHAGPLAEPRRIVFAVDLPSAEWAGAIAHEVAHVFGFDIIPGSTTPQWLVEGLAEYQRNSWDVADLVALRETVRAGGVPDIARLDAGDAGGDERLLYSIGHAAFEFVESRWGKDGVLQFLFALRQAAIRGGEPYEPALGLTAQEFDRAFGEHLRARFPR